ncbi:MAG: nitrogen fixation-related uncharacterized protein [Chlamydiales bacterium]
MVVYLAATLIGGLAATGVFVYFWKKGQFDDLEDVKYQMFRDEEQNGE